MNSLLKLLNFFRNLLLKWSILIGSVEEYRFQGCIAITPKQPQFTL
jgi:hypothetical protein